MKSTENQMDKPNKASPNFFARQMEKFIKEWQQKSQLEYIQLQKPGY